MRRERYIDITNNYFNKYINLHGAIKSNSNSLVGIKLNIKTLQTKTLHLVIKHVPFKWYTIIKTGL